MKKLRIYLDTSVVNFLFAEDASDFRRVTEDFFARHAQKYELFASEVVVLEILRDPNPEVMELQTSRKCPPRSVDRRDQPAGRSREHVAAALAVAGGR